LRQQFPRHDDRRATINGSPSSRFYLHTIPNGYPWTHLGYTYNWAPGGDRYGASEYVIRGNAKAVIVDTCRR